MDWQLERYPWWQYLDESQRDGLLTSKLLLAQRQTYSDSIHDFSFIVFPSAKAYEGFLKKLFFDLGFITEQEFNGDRFRIGKALNPYLEPQLRQESIYDKLAMFCQDKELPEKLWQTWKVSRNLVFHWWPGHKSYLTLGQARLRFFEIVKAIDSAFAECKIKR